MKKQTTIRQLLSMVMTVGRIGFMVVGILIITSVVKGAVSFASVTLSPALTGFTLALLMAVLILRGRKSKMTVMGFFHKGSEAEEMGSFDEELEESSFNRETLTAVTRSLDINR